MKNDIPYWYILRANNTKSNAEICWVSVVRNTKQQNVYVANKSTAMTVVEIVLVRIAQFVHIVQMDTMIMSIIICITMFVAKDKYINE